MTGTGPYRGLSPFAEADSPYFFGRDHDRRVIVANLIASPLTLLYAPSGVGKTSVLLAGVNPAVRQLMRDDGTPEYVPVVVRNWSGDGLTAIYEALAHSTGNRFGPNGTHLSERLAATATGLNATLLLVLDQFEEFMLYHGDAVEPGEVAWELTRVMTDRDLPARIMLGMREDSLAMLDRFKGRVPRLFANYLRLEHLDFVAARDAIVCPLAEWNVRHPDDVWEADDDLVDAVIEDVASGRVDLGRTGGAATTSGKSDQVETAFLQLVMTRLWEEERAHGSHRLQSATLRKLGGSSRLVRRHLDDRMRTLDRGQRKLAAKAFHQLVTPSGTKVAQSARDLAEYADASPAAVTEMLDTLSGGEWWILRRIEGHGSPRYEIFHDVLAEAVLDWRARFEERRRAARLVRLGVLALVLTVGAVALAVEFQRRAHAAVTARAELLAATARERLGSDPVGAVRAAARAVDIRSMDSTRAMLRTALMRAEGDGTGVLSGDPGRVRSLSISRDGRRVVTASADDQLQVWTLADGGVRTFRAPGVRTLTLSPDGQRVAAAGREHEVLVLGQGTPQRVSVPHESTFIRWSPTADVLLAGGPASATLIDLARGGHTEIPGGRGGQFSPGGSRVVTSTPEGVVQAWNLDGEPQGPPLPGDGLVVGLAFTARGERVVAARADGSVNVLRARGCGPPAGIGEVTRADFSEGGARVALMTSEGVHVVDVTTCKHTFLATPQDLPPLFEAISSDGRTVVAASADGAARVWDVPTGSLVATLLGDWREEARIGLRRAASGGEIVVSASDTGGIRSWRPAGLPVARVAVPRGLPAVGVGGALAVEFTGDGALLVATRAGVRSKQPLSTEPPRTLGDPVGIDLAAFSADGATVAVLGQDGHVRVRRTDEVGYADLGAIDGVLGLSLATDGTRLATTHAGRVRVWDVAARREIAGIQSPGVRQAAAFAGDDLVVAARELAVYDLPGAERRALDSPSVGAAVPVEAPVVATEGTWVAAAPRRGAITVRDLAAEDSDPVRLAGARGVRALAFAPGGAVLATAGEDGLQLWDARSGAPLVTLAARLFGAVAFSHDGHWVIAGGGADAEVFRCDACAGDDTVRKAADAFLREDNPPIAIAPLAAPTTDLPLAGEHEGPAGGGFAPPLADPNQTEDATETTPPEAASTEPPVATATPQVAPSGGDG